ncbi:hypothetical protein EDC01DRAFT_616572 [Geopyxis carbonaria]|nr:hypothetical protein EDC01DRAFT_616572 [Geopyxis carbonaria]
MMLQAPPADDIALRKRSSQVEVQTPRKKKAVPRRQQTTSSSDSGDYPETTNGKLEYKPLHIYDNDAVTTFYMTRLRQMQQLMCKVVSKAWIKVIEPKKQSNFPYNRGDESKPSWWPREVRHKEPDHLMKPERLTLLLTMLRCQKVPISKLESATSEVMVQIPNERIPLLEEIYRVARHEERANRNELPPDTVVYVAASEKIIKRPRSSTRKSATPNLRRQSIASPLSVHSGLGGVTSPISPHAGIGGGVQGDRRQSIQGSPQEIADNNQEMELQSGPSRMGSHDSNLQRVPPAHNPFSGSSVQPVIPTLAHPRGIEYNSNYVSQVSQVSQVSPIQATPQQQQGYGDIYYMVDQQAPPVPQQRHSIPFSGNAPRLNRAQTSPGASVFWSSQHSLNSGMYGPSFNSGNPQQQHSPHGNTQSLSTPSTPATATSFQLPPPPPPHANVPAMQQGQISAQGAHLEMGGMERRAEHQQYALGTQIRPGEHSFTDYLQNDHLASVQENSTEDNNGRLK